MYKPFYRIFLLILLFPVILNLSKSQTTDYNPEDFVLSNSNMGTDFWVAFPPNGTINEMSSEKDIAIYMASPYETTVNVVNEALGINKNVTVQPYQIARVNIGVNLEINISEEVTSKGIHISSQKPIMVYVVNLKQYSGEGYMAIPTSAFGLKYYHCSFFDFKGTGYWNNYKRSGGFVVVASENSTHIKIKLNGVVVGDETTLGGSEIGDLITETLQAGETFDVRGNGETMQMFDISGSEITSDKPIGVISYHMKTMLPQNSPNGTNHLVEMLLPVDKWGKEYATIQFDREQSSAKGEGDLFRVVASEANTDVDCEFYDISDYHSLGVRKPHLTNAGSFATYDDPEKIVNGNELKSIYGMSYWQSTKPFQLMQYAFSPAWDGDMTWSPQMVMIPPVDQFVQNTLIMTPDVENVSMNRTSLTLFAIGDPNDVNATLLKSIKLDGAPLTTVCSPNLISSNIPGTNIFWTRVALEIDEVHVITSDTKIAGYHSFLGFYNSFGWPVGVGSNIINDGDLDETAPTIEKQVFCGNYTIDAKESSSNDCGISKIVLLENASENYELDLNGSEDLIANKEIREQRFYLNVIDKNLPSTAAYAILDRAGNIIYDTVNYIPETAEFDKENLYFDQVRIKQTVNSNVSLTNTSADSITINEVMLKDSSVFVLSGITLPYVLATDESLVMTVSYTPTKEALTNAYRDTLTAYSDCNSYMVTMNGYGITPRISVEDFNFGDEIEIYSSKCIEDINKEGFRIRNTGSDTLSVSEILGIEPPFTISEPTDPELPLDIPPGDDVYITSICFIPNDTIQHTINVQVVSDADGENNDSIAVIKAKAWQEPEAVNEESDADCILKIMPNPSNNEDVKISYCSIGALPATLKIFDAGGNEIKSVALSNNGTSDSTILNVKDLPSGIYIIRLITGDKVYSDKLILYK